MHRQVLQRHKYSPHHSGTGRVPSVMVRCSRGFGPPTRKASKEGGGKGPAKTVEQAADLAEAGSRPDVRPINPKEAARGKVDYVKVKDWADGKAADLGELQVMPDSYTPGAFTAGGSGTSGPFYQQLARHAQYLESQGALSLAQEPGAKPFLPFESWQYSLPRYTQFLAELAAVHEALEQAVKLAVAPVPSTSSSSTAGIQNSNASNDVISAGSMKLPPGLWEVPGRSAAVLSAYAALGNYGPGCGLWRAAAAAADFAGLLDLAAADHSGTANRSTQPQQQQQVGPAASPHKDQMKLHTSMNAVAYGRYLLQLGKSAAAATTAAVLAAQTNSSLASSALLIAEEEEGYKAVLKLIAHAYAIHVQQQCLCTRIGAAATDHLDLLGCGVSSLYLDYPDHIQEPMQQLVTITNAAGRQLDAGSKQVVLDELPKALNKATLLLAPLATAV